MNIATEQPKATTLSAMRPVSQQIENLPVVRLGFNTLQGFELTQRSAKLFAGSTIVPKEYQGNVSNCAIALNIADRIGADPLMVMQNLVIVHGRPTWSSQFLIATVNTCGRFSALRYEFFGTQGSDTWGCRAWAIEKSTNEKLVGTDITIAIAKKEGWYGKNGSKWQSIPQQMLMYRAASWWTRAYAPELSMGLQTAEEMSDVYEASRNDDGSFTVDLDSLRQSAPEENSHPIVDMETGEILDQPKPPFDFETADLSTVELTKAASNDFLEFLKIAKDDERLGLFMACKGSILGDAIKKFGLGLDKQQFEKLGIKL